MKYLYGDSTPSKLTTNFLDLLERAVDFSVFVLLADERIRRARARQQTLIRDADTEIAELDALIDAVTVEIDATQWDHAERSAAKLASRLTQLMTQARSSSAASVRAVLTSEVAAAQGDETAARADCLAVLASFLPAFASPICSSASSVTLLSSGAYEAFRAGATAFGLVWRHRLAIPKTSLWATPFRVDSIVPHLEIRSPRVSGWISKEVKVRGQRIDRYVVTEVVTDDDRVNVSLRAERDASEGFDIEVDVASRSIHPTHLSATHDASEGAFEVHVDDVEPLLAFVEKLCETVAELKCELLLEATLDGVNVDALPAFATIVEKLVEALAPTVREIDERSDSRTELVLRRGVANQYREEVFLERAVLIQKLSVLPEPLRRLFDPFGIKPRRPTLPGPTFLPKDEESERAPTSADSRVSSIQLAKSGS